MTTPSGVHVPGRGARLRLRTPRFELRTFTPGDGAWLVELDADPAIRRYTGGGPAPTLPEIEVGPLSRLLAWHDRSDDLGFYWVHDRGESADGSPLGWVHLRPRAWADDPHDADPTRPQEIGWRLHRRAWGRGVATEATRSLAVDAVDRLDVPSLHAVAMPDNDASFRVMERLGLRYAGARMLHDGIRCIEYAVEATGLRRDDAQGGAATALRVRAATEGDRDALDRLGASGTATARVLVAEHAGQLVGAMRRAPAEGCPDLLWLEPPAVVTAHRDRGVEDRLVRAALTSAAEAGMTSAGAVGDEATWGRFGFEPAEPLGLVASMPDGSAGTVFVRALEGGRLPPPGALPSPVDRWSSD